VSAAGEPRNAVGVSGRTYPPVAFQIEADRAAEFARAIGADPTAGVPPTFAAVYSLGVTAPQLFADTLAAVEFARLLHAEQDMEFLAPLRPGDEITTVAKVASIEARPGGEAAQGADGRLFSFAASHCGAPGVASGILDRAAARLSSV